MKSAVSGYGFNLSDFVGGPFIGPGYTSVSVVDVDTSDVDRFNLAPLCEDRIFGDKVSDHKESSPPAVERAEESGAHPVEQFGDPRGAFNEFVVVEVVDYDIVGPVGPVSETSRRLTTTTGKKGHFGASYKFAFFPRAGIVLLSKVVNESLIILKFGLDIAQESASVVFGLSDHDHDINFPTHRLAVGCFGSEVAGH